MKKHYKILLHLTEGKYFRATNNNSLKNIYKDIDALEKSKIGITTIS